MAALLRLTTPHILRHSYATLLNDTGASIKTIQGIIGHADIQTTLNRYVHTREDYCFPAAFSRAKSLPWLKNYGRLPEYYISTTEAKRRGWNPKKGNLHDVSPGTMISRGVYENENGHLPSAPGRVWYEADIDYQRGFRGLSRILYSNDGLIFVTYDHYRTFIEIV